MDKYQVTDQFNIVVTLPKCIIKQYPQHETKTLSQWLIERATAGQVCAERDLTPLQQDQFNSVELQLKLPKRTYQNLEKQGMQRGQTAVIRLTHLLLNYGCEQGLLDLPDKLSASLPSTAERIFTPLNLNARLAEYLMRHQISPHLHRDQFEGILEAYISAFMVGMQPDLVDISEFMDSNSVSYTLTTPINPKLESKMVNIAMRSLVGRDEVYTQALVWYCQWRNGCLVHRSKYLEPLIEPY